MPGTDEVRSSVVGEVTEDPSGTISDDAIGPAFDPTVNPTPSPTSFSSSSSLASSSIPQPCNDIGNIITTTTSVTEICASVSGLSIADKYSLLFQHVSPPHILPSTFSHGCNRKFSTRWLQKYSWLRYSPNLDAVFCSPCAILVGNESRQEKGWLVNRPFSNWVKLSDVLNSHSKLLYHREALQDAEVLKATIENPLSRIDVMSNSALQSRMTENAHILRQIVRTILFLSKQGLALRGDFEDVHSSRNPGNFLAMLKMLAENDSTLHAHLHEPRAKNATYISPSIQNEIINVIGYDVIRANIIAEVKRATYFSVLADEVSSHNVEHLSLCLRFVDQQCDIREEFVSFVKLQRVRANDVSGAIVSSLEELGLSLNELRGQGYDGAPSMSGEKSGVQRLIRNKQPKAVYTHCAGHSFNLAIIRSCSVPTISNCIEQIRSLTIWIKMSPKREGLLKALFLRDVQSGSTQSRSPLLNVCITRWVENIDGWERFSLCHPFLIQMCEAIVYGNSELEMYSDNWPAEDKRNALAHLKALESFEFIYALVALQRSLLYLKHAVIALQGPDQDIVTGVGLIEQSCTELKALRENIDAYSLRIFQHSSRIAEQSGVVVAMPRVTQQQRNRANPVSSSIQEYFKLTITIPFLDHLISDLSFRFDAHAKRAASLQSIIPARITEGLSIDDISEGVEFYSDDLPNPGIVDEELSCWKSRWLTIPAKDRPQTISASLKQCSPETLPNIFTLLKLFATLPLSSCSCERSASAQKTEQLHAVLTDRGATECPCSHTQPLRVRN